ncbi:MAG: hypothetical protein JNJ58_05235 [Chitinophagaceae bacterium]|nr:hypothetical protein [Chitinophagaceae bacterium]
MQVFIFIFYLFLFIWFFKVFGIENNTGLSFNTIAAVFILKALAGCLNLYIHNLEYLTNDVFFYYGQTKIYLAVLSTNPGLFFKEWLFNWGDITHHLNFFSRGNMAYWSDLGTLVHTKYMILASIFTLGSEYANVVFYNVIFFIGQLLLYKCFYQLQPEKKYLFLISIFLVPSVIFWCSGIHKDGWVLAALGGICFYTLRLSRQQQWKDFMLLILCFILLLVLRYFYFLCLFPVYVIWLASLKIPRPLRVFMIGSIVMMGLIIALHLFFPGIDPLQIVVNKQIEYFKLKGYSDIHTPTLTNDLMSFVKHFPIALYHAFFIPVLKFTDPLKYIAAALDSLLIVVALFLSVIHIRRKYLVEAFPLFCLFFSMLLLLFMSYTIPNAGALVRYKSVPTALLLPAIIAMSEIHWLNLNKMKGWLKRP